MMSSLQEMVIEEVQEVDFSLLTLCDHHIRGLGTFGFTSAFLGTGSAVNLVRTELR
ncbi:hypothetical protein Anas_11308 [Armadillidium nasatum]|uniref:Uncharacterized protein n=1 Tax=Armadillidium nasatum TaxID=96803 RepID=A0A5N5TEU2_9CRUS|nr:hypothetical protein Anas_11308 [Armadillidium nasatum]